jgi:ArsR family transcriptional regulator, arsenate/arsenite/antimonite-responsive transcriptional repressor / arsenate reductase (thioredoxin)
LRLAPVRPRHVNQVLAPDDFVVTVCDTAHEELDERGRLHWSIPDPVLAGSDSAFDRAYEDLAERVGRLAPAVLSTEAHRDVII